MTTPQQPIDSGFGARSTAAEFLADIELSGRLAIVTGGYSGLGLETVRALSGAGASVIVPARRPGHAGARVSSRCPRPATSSRRSASTTCSSRRGTRSGRPTGRRRPPTACSPSSSTRSARTPALAGIGGVYCENCDIAEPTVVGSPSARIQGVDAHAIDPDAAARLWAVSAELTGVDAFAAA